MSKEISPQLFAIELEYAIYYIVAYDAKHALESLPGYCAKDIEELKSVKNLTDNIGGRLYIAEECLGKPGLVKKIKEEK
jgi:hypothetical protein